MLFEVFYPRHPWPPPEVRHDWTPKNTDQTPFTSGGMTGCLGLVSLSMRKTSNLFEEEFSLNKNWTTKKMRKIGPKSG